MKKLYFFEDTKKKETGNRDCISIGLCPPAGNSTIITKAKRKRGRMEGGT